MKIIIVSFLLIFLENGTFEKVVAESTENDNKINKGNGNPTDEDVDYDYGQPKGTPDAAHGDDLQTTTQLPKIKDCECGIFSSIFPTKEDLPIITQQPSYVECMYDGEEDCISLCSILAKAAMKNGPALICSILEDYEFLQASVHSRVLCNPDSDWIYTGLTASDYICCEESEVIPCHKREKRTITSANP